MKKTTSLLAALALSLSLGAMWQVGVQRNIDWADGLKVEKNIDWAKSKKNIDWATGSRTDKNIDWATGSRTDRNIDWAGAAIDSPVPGDA